MQTFLLHHFSCSISMEELSNFSSKYNSTSIDGKQIIWTQAAIRLNAHMKSEPLKRREQLKQAPRLKQKPAISELKLIKLRI